MNELVSHLNLAEGEFLPISIIFGFSLIIAFALRFLLRAPGTTEGEFLPGALDPFFVAYLSGGEKALIDVAIVSLVHRGALKLDTIKVRFLRTGTLTSEAHQVEAAVFGLVPAEEGASLDQLQTGAKESISSTLRGPLLAAGLLVATRTKLAVILIPSLFGLVAPGIAFLAAVLSRRLSDEKLASVLLFAVVWAVCVLVVFGRPPFRSRYGDQLLKQLRIKHANLATNPLCESGLPDSIAVPLAVGLFGAAILRHVIPLAHLQNVLDPPSPG